MKWPRSIGSIGAGKFIWSEQRLAAHKVPGVKARNLAARKFSRDASPLLALQQVADFREQRLLLGHRRRLRRLRLHDPIHQLDHEEQNPSDDDEIDDDGQETSPRQHGALLPGFGQRKSRSPLRTVAESSWRNRSRR